MSQCLPQSLSAEAGRRRREVRRLRPNPQPSWMPAKESQPIAQLIGGGPLPGYATFIHITARREMLALKMSKLGGNVVAEVTMKST